VGKHEGEKREIGKSWSVFRIANPLALSEIQQQGFLDGEGILFCGVLFLLSFPS
jgi:hypothetical protein